MSYVGLDAQGARALAEVLRSTANSAETLRSQTVGALTLADLTSQAPVQLGLAQDGLATLSTGIADRANLAEQFTVDPERLSASLGVPVEQLRTVLAAQVGLSGPTDLRAVFVGLAPPGADPQLDAALARLGKTLMPALMAGARPTLGAEEIDDLRLLALRLGISAAGPSVVAGTSVPPLRGRSGTEVFWHDFWADGRTVAGVLANPDQLLDWVAGTFDLDHRLALAAGLPELVDVLATYDFATAASSPADLTTALDAARAEFAAINGWLPAFLVGADTTGPDATQVAQTLAFAARVGWSDPGATAATAADRFATAIAFLRANRLLQSALLPIGFEGDRAPLAFLNEKGIELILGLGVRTGILDDTVVAGLVGIVDQVFNGLGANLSAQAPVELTPALQQQLFALVASQIPPAAAASPAIQAQFVASLGYLRQATTGPQLRQRIVFMLAAFRTLGITGAPALTERQLTEIVGPDALAVLGRSRLRLRSTAAVNKNPEFLLVARQWGVPGGHRQDLGKYKFSWSFNDLGVLDGIRRKKKSTLSRIVDTIKAVGKAIVQSWKDNPFKAIFQVGKIALGVAAMVVPGLQALGAASLALSVAEAGYHAIQGDWLAAIGAGLSAFTAGATDIFGAPAQTIISGFQNTLASDLLGTDLFSVVKDVKRVFDIGTTIYNATQAKTLVGAIASGIGAVATTVGAGSQLLGSLGALGKDSVNDLVRLGLTVRDVASFVAPAAGVVQALDQNNPLAALGNGLSIISLGARALVNPAGAFTNPRDSVFAFEPATRDALRAIASGTGVAANVSLAINAADQGNSLLAGSFLAQAVQAANDPLHTAVGSQAKVAQRVAEIGAALEAVFDRKASPASVAPLLLTRVNDLLTAATTPVTEVDHAAPSGLAGSSGQSTLVGAASQSTPAGQSTSAGSVTMIDVPTQTTLSSTSQLAAADIPNASTMVGVSGQDGPGGGAGDDMFTEASQIFTSTASGSHVLTSAALNDLAFDGMTLTDQVLNGHVLDGEAPDAPRRGVVALDGTSLGGMALDGQDLPAAVVTGLGTTHIPLPVPESFTIPRPGIGLFSTGGLDVHSDGIPGFWLGVAPLQLNTENPAEHFPPVDSMAFTYDPLLDGEISRRWDFAFGVGASFGYTMAGRGPSSASEGIEAGWAAGASFTTSTSEGPGPSDPVDGGTQRGTGSFSLLGGPYGFLASANVEAHGDGPSAADIFLGVHIPDLRINIQFPELTPDPDFEMEGHDTTIGFRVGYGPDGLNGRWADRTDFPTVALSAKWGGMATGEDKADEERTRQILTTLSDSPYEEVKVTTQVPSGTRISFAVDPSVTAAATPGFPYVPGEGGAAEAPSLAVPPGVSFVDSTTPTGAYPYGQELVNEGWSGNLADNVQEWTANRGDQVPGWTNESWSNYAGPYSDAAPQSGPSDFADIQPFTYDSSSIGTADVLSDMDFYGDTGASYNWAE